MKPVLISSLASPAVLGAVLFGLSAAAVPGGDLDVMPQGSYICELPGDASDPGLAGGRRQPKLDFAIIGDSSYRSGGLRGVYLLTGDRMLMTSGPLQGHRFHHVETSFLRAINPDGSDGDLRCISSIQAFVVPDEGRKCKTAKPQEAAARADGTRPAAC